MGLRGGGGFRDMFPKKSIFFIDALPKLISAIPIDAEFKMYFFSYKQECSTVGYGYHKKQQCHQVIVIEISEKTGTILNR